MNFPFENENQKIIQKIAVSSFRASSLRNLIAVLSIILTAVLFTSVATIALGAQQSLMVSQQMQKMSKSDGDLRYMTRQQYEKLKENENIKKAGLRMPVAYLSNGVRHNIELQCADETQQELTFCEASHGDNPSRANEVVASDRALEELGVKREIGAEVPVEFEARGKTYKMKMTLCGWYESINNQTSVMVAAPSFAEAYPEIFRYTYGDDYELAGTYWSDVVLKGSGSPREKLEQTVIAIGGNPYDEEAENYVPAVVNNQTNPELDPSMAAALAVFCLMFVLCGYLLIYNVFDIAVMQEVRRYGLYRTVGMSKRQVRKLISRQAVWLALIGIPAGLLIGFFIGKAALPRIMEMMASEYKNLSVSVSPHPFIFFAAALLTAFTVWLSIRKPLKTASRISPIEAFRYVENGAGRKKAEKRSGGARLWRMALSNLGRNKRRAVFIVLSLLLCIVLLNSMGVIAGSVDVEKMVSEQIRTDFEVASVNTMNLTKGFSQRSDGISMETAEEILRQPGVKESSLVYKNTLDDRNVTFDYGTKLTDIQPYQEGESDEAWGTDPQGRAIDVGNDGYPSCNVIGMEKASLARLHIVEGESDPDRLYRLLTEENGIIAAVSAEQGTNEPQYDQYENLPLGRTVRARIDGKEAKTYKVVAKAAATSDDYEFGFVNAGSVRVGGDAPFFFLHAGEFKNLYQKPAIMKVAFNVEDAYKEGMEQFLSSYTENAREPVGYLSSADARAAAEAERAMIYLVGGIISSIFGLAGVLNLVNMIVTSVLARRREFATMKSIGMTGTQLRKMVTMEGVYYALGAGIAGIFLSSVCAQTLLKSVCSFVWHFTFRMTLTPALLAFLVLLLFSLAMPAAVLKLFDKGSVVEQLRAAE